MRFANCALRELARLNAIAPTAAKAMPARANTVAVARRALSGAATAGSNEDSGHMAKAMAAATRGGGILCSRVGMWGAVGVSRGLIYSDPAHFAPAAVDLD